MNTRKPVQKRSVKTVNRIKEAAKKLFLKKGVRGTSSNEIAALAEVSIGSFYSYYKDKDQLFREILSEIKDDGILKYLRGLESMKNDTPYSVFRNMISHVQASHNFSSEFHRDTTMMRLKDSETAMLYESWEIESIKLMSNYLSFHSANLRLEDLKLASQVVLTTVEEFSHALTFERIDEEPQRVIDQVTDMIIRYLFI